MKQLTQSLLETIKKIENRPSMFMTEVNFIASKNLLFGYLLGVETVTGISFNQKLNLWLNERYKSQSSLVWTQHILHLLAKDNQEIAYQLLFDNLKLFLEEMIINLTVEDE